MERKHGEGKAKRRKMGTESTKSLSKRYFKKLKSVTKVCKWVKLIEERRKTLRSL